MNKKSQVTIFIIIGVIVLVSLGLILMFTGDSATPGDKPETEQDELDLFVSQCLKDTTEQALQTAGMHGGYIGINEKLPSVNERMALQSPYLSIFDGNVKMPYWYYENTEGLQSSEMPPLYKQRENDSSIQSQLEIYIEQNLNECLNGFKSFEDQNIIIKENSAPQASVDFTDSKVLIDLEYGLELNKNKSIVNKQNFKTSVPVRMKRVYSLAKDIAKEEMDSAFLEDKLRDLINSHSRIDSDYLPPMYGGVEMTSCAEREFWVADEVKNDFREMLTANIPYIQIENAKNNDYQVDRNEFESEEDADIAQGVMDRLKAKVSEDSYSAITADFSYQDSFPMQLDFNEGGFLEPKTYEMNIVIGHYCFFEYKFYYNTKFPVIITLYDEKSKIDNKGYMFQFPLMVVLKDNFPRVRWGDLTPEDKPKMKTYQCSQKQRLSGESTVTVRDEKGRPVKNAYVTFQCGPGYIYDYDENGSLRNVTKVSDKCFIGKTDETGVMKERFPPCYGGGIMEVKAKGHLGKLKLVKDIEENKEYDYSFTLPSVVEKDVVLEKYFVEPPVPEGLTIEDNNPAIESENGNITKCRLGSKFPIESNEKVIIRLKKLDAEDGILQTEPFALYTTERNASIKLAPGTYRADLMLIRNERYPGEMTINKNSQMRKADGGSMGSDETFYYPEEDVELSSVTTGGAVYEFEITPDELYNNEKIRFSIIDEGPPKFIENVGRAINDRKSCAKLNPKLTAQMEK